MTDDALKTEAERRMDGIEWPPDEELFHYAVDRAVEMVLEERERMRRPIDPLLDAAAEELKEMWPQPSAERCPTCNSSNKPEFLDKCIPLKQSDKWHSQTPTTHRISTPARGGERERCLSCGRPVDDDDGRCVFCGLDIVPEIQPEDDDD